MLHDICMYAYIYIYIHIYTYIYSRLQALLSHLGAALETESGNFETTAMAKAPQRKAGNKQNNERDAEAAKGESSKSDESKKQR